MKQSDLKPQQEQFIPNLRTQYTATFTFDGLQWILGQNRVFLWRRKRQAKLKADLELYIEKRIRESKSRQEGYSGTAIKKKEIIVGTSPEDLLTKVNGLLKPNQDKD